MITRDDIQSLLTRLQKPVLSLYININNADPANQAAAPAWQIEIRDQLDALGKSRKDPQFDQFAEAARAYMRQFRGGGKSAAAFFDANGMREYRFQFPVQTQVHYGEPLITPMLWLIDEYEPYLIALVDQEKAYLLHAYLGQTRTEATFEIDIDDYDFHDRPEYQVGLMAQGDFRELYEKMIDEHRMRYYREVAGRIDEMCREKGYSRLILGGAEESAKTIQKLLPDRVAKQVVAVLPIPMRSDAHAIMERMLPIAAEYERKFESALVSEVIDFAKAGGRGALGMRDVMQAMEQQRIELLVLPYPVIDPQMADLSLKMFASKGEIELVHGAAADRLNAEGGIGARLYYAIPTGKERTKTAHP